MLSPRPCQWLTKPDSTKRLQTLRMWIALPKEPQQLQAWMTCVWFNLSIPQARGVCSNSFNLYYDLRSLNKYAILININTLLLSKYFLLVTDLVSSEISVADISREIFKFTWKPVSKFKRYEKSTASLFLQEILPHWCKPQKHPFAMLHFFLKHSQNLILKTQDAETVLALQTTKKSYERANLPALPALSNTAWCPRNKTTDEMHWQSLSFSSFHADFQNSTTHLSSSWRVAGHITALHKTASDLLHS